MDIDGEGEICEFTAGQDLETQNSHLSMDSQKLSRITDIPFCAEGNENVFKTMLTNIAKESELDMMVDGFLRFLKASYDSQTAYLPNAHNGIAFAQEVLILLWHVCSNNKDFVARLVLRKSNEFVVYIVYIMTQVIQSAKTGTVTLSKNMPNKNASTNNVMGILHITSFILLVLSADRGFAVGLNEAAANNYAKNIEVPIFQGNYADLMVLALYRVISECLAGPATESLVDMLFTILCNISPYVKAFCPETCLKIFTLLERVAKPSYLFRNAQNHMNLFFLLDFLNNVVQYQAEGNQVIIYSILRNAKIFERLDALDVCDYFSFEEQEICTKRSERLPESGSNSNFQLPDGIQENELAVWFDDWKERMPIRTVLRLLECLGPQVEEACMKEELVSSEDIVNFLKKTTMVGLLPVPHPIVIRTYLPNTYTAMWFTTFIWGVIFSRVSHVLPMFDWTKIRLVLIND